MANQIQFALAHSIVNQVGVPILADDAAALMTAAILAAY
jgi:hypothetical protein